MTSEELLSGGTESLAVTVEWAIPEILSKPQIFKKATEELDAVIRQGRHAQPSIH
ncbi:cytochrome P450 71A1 [Artemisia annua]|uniref:Cytochrome P450 71A1 n=1 Tax=Artemisia annua TaxID=35608 RepID=A0A2U1KKD5_ARTAN|nr:cytochrome P450 71A1 [Artemisia annua]